MLKSFVLECPWWLILIIPIIIGIITKVSSTYFSKAHLHTAPIFLSGMARTRKSLQYCSFQIPNLTKILVLVLMILALTDITKGYTVITGQKVFHRIIVSIDVSSSMYGYRTNISNINCKHNANLFIRIRGSCRALYRLVNEVEKEAKDEKRPRILLGLLQFASKSAVVSYPTSDYARFRKKIDVLEFKSHGLDNATDMHDAIWDMFIMALDRNMSANSNFTNLTADDINTIYTALAPGPKESALHIPKSIAEKMAKIKNEMKDTIFIIPTDAVMHYLKKRMDGQHPSIRRLLQLAELIEIPVYFISTDEDYPELKRLAVRTGFGPLGGQHRGNFLMVRREKDEYLIDEIVGGILKSRFGMKIPISESRRKSYSGLAIELSLTFLGFGILWKKYVARSLTDIE